MDKMFRLIIQTLLLLVSVSINAEPEPTEALAVDDMLEDEVAIHKSAG
jgi:hypothetical protein